MFPGIQRENTSVVKRLKLVIGDGEIEDHVVVETKSAVDWGLLSSPKD